MSLYQFVVPLGILTFLSLIATVVAGALKAKLKVHRTLAIITVIAATCHAGIIIYLKSMAK